MLLTVEETLDALARAGDIGYRPPGVDPALRMGVPNEQMRRGERVLPWHPRRFGNASAVGGQGRSG